MDIVLEVDGAQVRLLINPFVLKVNLLRSNIPLIGSIVSTIEIMLPDIIGISSRCLVEGMGLHLMNILAHMLGVVISIPDLTESISLLLYVAGR